MSIVQGAVIRTDAFIMPVLHAEPAGDGAELYETEPFIQMPGVDVAFHNSIKLKHSKSEFFTFLQTIQN